MPVFCVVSLCRQNSRTVRPERGILRDRRMEPEAYALSGLKSFPDAREICYTDCMRYFDIQLASLGTIDSSNEEIKRRCAALKTGNAVMCQRQTNGRGRLGRTFESDRGMSLCLSVYFDMPEPRLTATTSVCVCRAIEKLYGLRPQIKWPNDILVEGRKLCGILAETAGSGMVVGIGINMAQKDEDFSKFVRGKAVSLKQIFPKIGCTIAEKRLLAETILQEMKREYESVPISEILDEYRLNCVTIGQVVRVRFTEKQSPKVGIAEGLNDDFSLNIRWSDGSIEKCIAGEVQIHGLNGYI